jgi:hypothetical protein
MLNRVNVPASPHQPDEPASNTATDIILIPGDLERPVFVDTSGRRRRRLRLFCYGFGVVCLAYSGLVGMSLAGGPVAPEGDSAFPALADGPRQASPTRTAPASRPAPVIVAQPWAPPEEPVRTPPVPTPAPTLIVTTRPPTAPPSPSPSSPASPSATPPPTTPPTPPTPQPTSAPTSNPTRSAPSPTRAGSANAPSASPSPGATAGRLAGLVARVQ